MQIIVKGTKIPEACIDCPAFKENDEFNQGIGKLGICKVLDKEIAEDGRTSVDENCPVEQDVDEYYGHQLRKALIISAFPGMGKSHYFKNNSCYSFDNELVEHPGNRILDSDSSDFSWIKDENGNNTTVRNPEFPENYIRHIKCNLYNKDIIFVSSHKQVREALEREGLHYAIVYPGKKLKNHLLERYEKRGSSQAFIKLMLDNFDSFVEQIEEETFPLLVKINEPNEFIDEFLIRLIKENLESDF